jgi:hypothetical protein
MAKKIRKQAPACSPCLALSGIGRRPIPPYVYVFLLRSASHPKTSMRCAATQHSQPLGMRPVGVGSQERSSDIDERAWVLKSGLKTLKMIVSVSGDPAQPLRWPAFASLEEPGALKYYSPKYVNRGAVSAGLARSPLNLP